MTDPTVLADAAAGRPDQVSLEDLRELARRVLSACGERGRRLATAESCTGGLVGHVLTEVPGASACYLGGAIAYADATKAAVLDVPQATLARHGAVSAQTAVAMAEGVRRRLGADLALAVTGIAGPDGGTPDKPVGLTYVAVADGTGHEARRFAWSGDRSANKRASAAAALDLALTRLSTAAD
ncbi:MAG TPA: nicotinamide-nucleotide amidohydrolase family protein [Candidatus Limnocylindrales bacterium]|jgi:PncC family amidohydrolase|nr:nicotinamide-nucleotide amidohydrolase family protein [Candidatus Limnocylindrales bacterium]